MLKGLSERDRTIICMAAGYGYEKEYKDREIADILEMSSERVRQIRNALQTKLAKMYNKLATVNA
jgi:DNA-directed RNA polymerase sigma subunit (sigma70/sigma32)